MSSDRMPESLSGWTERGGSYVWSSEDRPWLEFSLTPRSPGRKARLLVFDFGRLVETRHNPQIESLLRYALDFYATKGRADRMPEIGGWKRIGGAFRWSPKHDPQVAFWIQPLEGSRFRLQVIESGRLLLQDVSRNPRRLLRKARNLYDKTWERLHQERQRGTCNRCSACPCRCNRGRMNEIKEPISGTEFLAVEIHGLAEAEADADMLGHDLDDYWRKNADDFARGQLRAWSIRRSGGGERKTGPPVATVVARKHGFCMDRIQVAFAQGLARPSHALKKALDAFELAHGIHGEGGHGADPRIAG